MRHITFTLTPLIVAGSAMLMHSSAQAAIISLNITDSGTGRVLAPGDVVGVVEAANWNNTVDSTTSNLSLSNLVNNSGDATTADVSVGGASFLYQGGSAASPHPAPNADDSIMMGTSMGSSGSGDDRTITFTQVPFAVYDIYVYFGGAASDATFAYVMNVSYQAWDGAIYNTVGDTKYMRDANSARWDGTYNESLATTAAAATAGDEYVKFSSITGDRFRILADNVSRRAGFSGIQIVEAVPEPASLALAALGGLMMTFRGRRR